MTRVKMYGVASLVDEAVRYFREPQAGDSMPANSSRVKLVKSLQQEEAKYKVVCSSHRLTMGWCSGAVERQQDDRGSKWQHW